jgi:ABC-type Zn uptake system ZnuABC Zn-binding protein ZnuA
VLRARTAVLAIVLLTAVRLVDAGGGGLSVVTTSTDLKSLVEVVGGDRVAVESLAPPLQDPHAIEVKPGQIARLRAAALLVRVGLDHEPWLPPLLATAGDPRLLPGGPAELDASRGIRLLQAETPRLRDDSRVHLHGLGNTHYWLDPENARPITAAILARLSRLVPPERDRFAANRDRFLERLDAGLGRWTRALAPYRGVRVVVVHDTWPYFAERFGLRIVAAVEPTPGVPPSPAGLAALTERMRAASVRVLLAEPYANEALVRQIAERSGGRVVTLVPSVGGDPAAGDYVALFDLNVGRLAEALAGAR